MKRTMKRTAMIFAAVFVLWASPGCDGFSVQKFRDAIDITADQVATVDATIAELESQKQIVDEQIATLPAGPEREKWESISADLDAMLAKAKPIREALAAQLDQYRADLADAEDSIDLIEITGKNTAPLLPEPWGAILILGTTTIAGILRSFQNGKRAKVAEAEAAAGADVIRAIEAAKTSGVIDFNDPETVGRLNTVMKPAGTKLVDSVQGKPAK